MDTPSDQPLYFAAIDGQERGPYQLDFIEALVLSGVFSSDVQVRKQDSPNWVKLSSIIAPKTVPPPPAPKSSVPPTLPSQRPKAVSPPMSSQLKGCGSQLLSIGCVFLAIVCSAAVKSCNSPSQTYSPTYSSPPAATYTPPPTSKPAPVFSPAPVPQSSVSPDQSTVTPATAPETTYSVQDSSGRSYRVSHSDYEILGQKEAALTSLLGVINRMKTNREYESREIERERATVDNTDQAALDLFNAKVDKYNQEGTLLDQQIDAYNAGVNDHNDYLLQVGKPSQ